MQDNIPEHCQGFFSNASLIRDFPNNDLCLCRTNFLKAIRTLLSGLHRQVRVSHLQWNSPGMVRRYSFYLRFMLATLVIYAHSRQIDLNKKYSVLFRITLPTYECNQRKRV